MIALSSLKQDEYEAGEGIAIDTSNAGLKVIRNTGVVTLTEGANISITDLGSGNFEITSSAGGDITAVSEIIGGTGIQVTNPTGPTATIKNTGALGLVAGTNVSVSNLNGYWTVNAADAPITSITAGTGISITGTSNPVISNAGVTSVSAGSGISISGTGTPSISNAGVISLAAGTNTTVSNLGSGVWQVNAGFPVSTESTYTVTSRTNDEEIIVPAGAQFADLTIISHGGPAGANDTSNPPLTVYGGSGAGGTTCTTYRMPVRENQKFKYQYGSSYNRVYFTIQNYTTYTQLAYVPAGGAGQPGTNLGEGGQPGANPTLSSSYAWTYYKGSAGESGFDNPATTAGSPYNRPFVGPVAPSTQVDTGCGARTTNETYGRGTLYITFYLA